MDGRLPLSTSPLAFVRVLSLDSDDVPFHENKMKRNDKKEHDKINLRQSKLGRSQQSQPCSKYCVLFGIMMIMKVALVHLVSSPSSICVVLFLSQCGIGGSTVEGVTVDRDSQQHHRHHHSLRGNWQDLHTRSGGNLVNDAGKGRDGVTGSSRPLSVQGKYNDDRGESRGLNRVLDRLEGRGPGGRRERRDEDSGRDGMAEQEQKEGRPTGSGGENEKVGKEEDHHHRQLPILPNSSAAKHHRHSPPLQPVPRGHHQHQQKLTDEDDTENQVDDDEDDEDYDDNYDDHDDLTTETNVKMSQWAENYKSRYLAGKQRAPVSTTSTTTSTTTPAPNTPSPSYTQWKWQALGTREGLEQYRRQRMGTKENRRKPQVLMPPISPHYHQQPEGRQGHGVDDNEPAARAAITDAIEHAMRVKEETECKVPRPKVVRVQDLYPSPIKSYVPHCTVLHQCSDDTGCCRQQTETCAPKYTHRVELAFYSISLDQSRDPIVERLVFYNHSECECRDKMDEMMPRDQSYQHQDNSYSSRYSPAPPPPHKLDSITNIVKVDDQDNTKFSLCKCPSVFSKRPLPGDACSCDCFDGQMDCVHLKQGRDFFNLSDKWCIQSGRCEVPECAFGSYLHLIGRCPRKNDLNGDSTSWTKYVSS